MTGFTVVFGLIVITLSIATIATRGTSARQQPPPKRVLRRRNALTPNPPPPPRTLRRPHKARQRAYYQRRIRHIQREHLLFVLFVLRQPTPPAPDV